MFKVIERALRRLFPELFNGYHLPMLARVVAVADAPAVPGIVDDYRPRFAADIRILNPDGTVNQKLPRYNAVPLPAPMAGHDQGLWGFAQPGALVEVAFAYGNPAKPFIRAVLSGGMTSPAVQEGDQVWQHSPGIHQTVDSAGNWQRTTDKAIHDNSTDRLIEAIECVQKYHHLLVEVLTNSTEKIGGTKSIEAMGAMRLQAGEEALLMALKDLKLATNKALRTYSKENTEIQTDKQLRALAAELAHLEAPKVWLGSDSVNSVQVLLDLIGVVKAIATTLATHTHGGPPPDQSSDFNSQKSDANELQSTLQPIVE